MGRLGGEGGLGRVELVIFVEHGEHLVVVEHAGGEVGCVEDRGAAGGLWAAVSVGLGAAPPHAVGGLPSARPVRRGRRRSGCAT